MEQDLDCERQTRCKLEREKKYSDLSSLNPKEELIKKATECIGKTVDIREAGYILEDGSLLDFSGKRFGGTPKTRSMDHREIGGTDECRVINTGEKGLSGDDAMEFFEGQANAIRFHYSPARLGVKESNDINVSLNTFQKPTEKQVHVLKEIVVSRKPVSIYLDVFDECGSRITYPVKEVEDTKISDVDDLKKEFDKLRQKACYKE